MAGYSPSQLLPRSFAWQSLLLFTPGDQWHFYRKHKVTTGILLQPRPVTKTCCVLSFFQKNEDILFLPSEWRGLPMQTDIDSLKLRINQLHLEHRDLDDVIARLGEKPGQDQLQLQRLKKKKLLLKDQIWHLERQLTPDIRA
ncbi:MAG: DUF465 domain-containing protein [Pseudomonadota bacterium]